MLTIVPRRYARLQTPLTLSSIKSLFFLFLYFFFFFWFIFLLYSLGLLSPFFVLCFGFFYFLISWEVRIRVTTTSFQKRWTAVTPIAYCFSVKAFSQTLLTFVAGPSRWRDGKGFLFLLLIYILVVILFFSLLPSRLSLTFSFVNPAGLTTSQRTSARRDSFFFLFSLVFFLFFFFRHCKYSMISSLSAS